jgi:D-alanyl-D-alanine carboxypeptidase
VQAGQAASGGSEAVGNRLQALLDRQASKRNIPHVVLCVERGDGSLRWTGAAGEARPGQPMRPDTPYFIASVTKLHIATCVLQLHEEGSVDLRAPITDYLPTELVDGLHRLDGVDHTPQITVRHLLSHTSGLPDFLEDAPKGERSLLDRVLAGEDPAWGFEDVVAIARDLTPHFPPQDLAASRQRARYSDTGFQLLIAIIEAVTGKAFHEVLEARVFEPLGLRHTWLPDRSRLPAEVGEPAAMWHRDRLLDMPQAVRSCNDLMGTAADTLTFLKGLVHGQVFADPATAGLMQQRWNRIFYPLRYGLGMMQFRIARAMAPGRRPVTLVGHSGASGSWAFYCPELDVLMTGTFDQWAARSAPFWLMAKALRVIHR